MPGAGMTIANSARSNAMRFIDRITDSAQASARFASSAIADAHTRPPQLVPSTKAQIADMNAFLERGVIWENDMLCYARASVGARHVNEVLGHGLTPVDDAYNAAVAILQAPPGRGWSFHAGIAMKDASGRTMVIDHLTQFDPMPLREWAEAYGVSEAKTFVVSPWAGSKVNSNTTGSGTWDWIRNSLTKTWNEADKWGVDIERNT